MKRVVGLAAGLYLAAALVGHARERLGRIGCGCAEGCWCKRRGLGLFRWVFPYGHRSRWEEGLKPMPVS